MQDDHEPDWYGHKQKRKRDGRVRRWIGAPFAFGILILAIMLVRGVVLVWNASQPALLSTAYAPSPMPSVLPAAVLTQTFAAVATEVHNIAFQQTAIAGFNATATAHASITAVSATPMPLVIDGQLVQPATAIDHVYEYTDANNAKGMDLLRILEVNSLPGYLLRGLQFGSDGLLYAAHTRNKGIGACDANEAYWVIDTKTSQHESIAYSAMVSARQIGFDTTGNMYILASDCEKQADAVFMFDSARHFVDSFTVIGADDLVVLNGDPLVFISGYANNYDAQPHILQLHGDSTTGKLTQVRQWFITNGGRFRSVALMEDRQIAGIWAMPDHADQLIRMIPGPPATPTPMSFNNTSLAGPLSIFPAQPTQWPGTFIQTASGGSIAVTNLALSNYNTLVGLRLDLRALVWFNTYDGRVVETPLIGLTPHAFVIEPTTNHWFFSGQQVAS